MRYDWLNKYSTFSSLFMQMGFIHELVKGSAQLQLAVLCHYSLRAACTEKTQARKEDVH